MGKTFGSQMKIFALLLGGILLAKFWNPLREWLGKFESDFKVVFGLSGDKKGGGTFLGKLNTTISEFFGDKEAKGSFFGSIKESISSGLKEVWDRIKLFFEERADAVKTTWDNGKNTSSLNIPGQLERLGNTIVAALTGYKGLDKSATRSAVDDGSEQRGLKLGDKEYNGTKEKAKYDRTKLQKLDYDDKGVLTREGALVASNSAAYFTTVKDDQLYTRNVAKNIEDISKQNREGDTEVNPSFFYHTLGLTTRQVLDLEKEGLLKRHRYNPGELKMNEYKQVTQSKPATAGGNPNSYTTKVVQKANTEPVDVIRFRKGNLDKIAEKIGIILSFEKSQDLIDLENRIKEVNSRITKRNLSEYKSAITWDKNIMSARAKSADWERRREEIDKEYEDSPWHKTEDNFKDLIKFF